jgi:hypothetical protein
MKKTDKELEKLIEEWCGRSKTNWRLVLLSILMIIGAALFFSCN